jgi:hypothetical protein
MKRRSHPPPSDLTPELKMNGEIGRGDFTHGLSVKPKPRSQPWKSSASEALMTGDFIVGPMICLETQCKKKFFRSSHGSHALDTNLSGHTEEPDGKLAIIGQTYQNKHIFMITATRRRMIL